MGDMMSVTATPAMLQASINICRHTYGACNYLEISKPLHSLLIDLEVIMSDSINSIKEQVEFVITDKVGFTWKATKDKGGQGIEMNLTR